MAIKAIAELIEGEFNRFLKPLLQEPVISVENVIADAGNNPEVEHLDYVIGYLKTEQLKLNRDNSDSLVADVAINNLEAWDGYEETVNKLMELRNKIVREECENENPKEE